MDPVFAKARARTRVIALSEGEDARVVAGALRAVADGLARVILVGDRGAVRAALAAAGGHEGPEVKVMDPAGAAFADAFHDLRKHKGVTLEQAGRLVRQPLTFAAMLVRQGLADGTVGGAVATTADTVRAALQVVGLAPGVSQVSSFFLMALDAPHHGTPRVVVFADCAMVVDPDAAGMAGIALASARSFQALMGEEPKVAMLSFSTRGSAVHDCVTKVAEATALLRGLAPDLAVDGELQFDAAFVPEIAATKAKGSAVAGQANVFVFPSLEAGNIGYKIAQRIGGARAIGPVLQGLAAPANDLSRGCNADDVYNMIAVTAAQAE